MSKTIMGLAFVAIMLGASVGVWGAETQPTATQPSSGPAREPSAEMAKLVRALEAGNFQERQEAQKKLEGLGAEALEDLKAALAQAKDDEVKARVGKATEVLQAKALLTPTLVTADFKEATPQDVVVALEKALGREIEVWPPLRDPINQRWTVTMELKQVPFWEAMTKINEQLPLMVGEAEHSGAMRLFVGQGHKDAAKWQQTSGPFAFRLLGLTRTNSVDLNGEDEKVKTNFYASIQVMADPRLCLTKAPEKLVLTKAMDNNGHSLLAKEEAGSGSSYGFVWQRNVRMQYPQGAGDRIATLAGTAKFCVTLETAAMEVNDLVNVKPKEQALAGMKVTVLSVKEDGYNMTAKIKFERGTMDKSRFSSLFELGYDNGMLKLVLVDAEGKTRRHNGFGGGGNNDERTCDYVFYLLSSSGGQINNKLVPVKLRIETPVKTREIEVPFEFKDVPLP